MSKENKPKAKKASKGPVHGQDPEGFKRIFGRGFLFRVHTLCSLHANISTRYSAPSPFLHTSTLVPV
jgi:hypothetical protein